MSKAPKKTPKPQLDEAELHLLMDAWIDGYDAGSGILLSDTSTEGIDHAARKAASRLLLNRNKGTPPSRAARPSKAAHFNTPEARDKALYDVLASFDFLRVEDFLRDSKAGREPTPTAGTLMRLAETLVLKALEDPGEEFVTTQGGFEVVKSGDEIELRFLLEISLYVED